MTLQSYFLTSSQTLRAGMQAKLTCCCSEMQVKDRQRSGWHQWTHGGGAAAGGRRVSGRAAVLEPYVQQQCAAAAAAIAATLEARLAALPAARPGQPGAAVVEQALLLGMALGTLLWKDCSSNPERCFLRFSGIPLRIWHSAPCCT
jgi:hypothetical protein